MKTGAAYWPVWKFGIGTARLTYNDGFVVEALSLQDDGYWREDCLGTPKEWANLEDAIEEIENRYEFPNTLARAKKAGRG